jgi:hypothetical protein
MIVVCLPSSHSTFGVDEEQSTVFLPPTIAIVISRQSNIAVAKLAL